MWETKSTNAWPAQMVSMLVAFGMLLALSAPAFAGRIEAGSFTAHDTFVNGNTVRVNFQQTFDTIPVVVALADQNGNNSASIRITNISTTGFDELILEPDNWDGRHIVQNVHYIAVEPGRHVLPDGRIIEAGRLNTAATQFGSGFTGGTASWTTVSFSSPLPVTPSVISQIQTANSETRTVATQSSRPHITAITQGLGLSGFQVALERSQANSGPFPSSETVGWIAFPGNLNGSFPDIANSNVTWSTVNTAANIRGWDNGCFTNSFGQNSGSRIVVAKKTSRNNADGGWLRRCSLSSTTIGLRVDEDRDQDNERSVAAGDSETASIIAFSRNFHANLEPDISVSKTSVSFADTLGSGFALPGATVEYLITVQNNGNAPPNYDSIVITELLPPELDFIVADFGAPGSGPFAFQDGSPASGLSCPFISLGSMTDCYSFSIDGANFDYVPSDSGDGTDEMVTHIRITPTSFMAPNTGSGATSFALRFKGRID
ncbi:MAG: H-type lectin domain-containing protein [Parasphingorhabdus sp.]|uniref:H-type lectin domain-containing protein n=1 Tax=Parasphingorhabdus sp. TaxID=2709688 RepID=UPI003299F1E4